MRRWYFLTGPRSCQRAPLYALDHPTICDGNDLEVEGKTPQLEYAPLRSRGGVFFAMVNSHIGHAAVLLGTFFLVLGTRKWK